MILVEIKICMSPQLTKILVKDVQYSLEPTARSFKGSYLSETLLED